MSFSSAARRTVTPSGKGDGAVVDLHLQGTAFPLIGFVCRSRLASRFDDDGIAGDGVKTADFITGPALDAFALIQIVRLGTGPGDSAGRTDLDAALAAGALLLDDPINDQVAADGRRTALVHDMGQELLPEILERRQDRIGRRLAQPAERSALDRAAQLLQLGDVGDLAFALA